MDYYLSVGKEAIRITDETCIDELSLQMNLYEPIKYDHRPLLMSCPFKTINPAIISLVNSG